MASELRQKLRRAIPMQENGQQELQNQTGINLETDIDTVVACLSPDAGGARSRAPAWCSRAAASTKRKSKR